MLACPPADLCLEGESGICTGAKVGLVARLHAHWL